MHEHVHKSRFLSLVLRHRSQEIGLSLDSRGWAEIDELLFLANQAGVSLTVDGLSEIVGHNDKQRFEISPNGLKIRASQGHSLHVELDLTPLQPPEVLYHGTATRFLKSIAVQGLIPGSRQHVHLSMKEMTARNVGARHGAPHVLLVQSMPMYEAGFQFYRSENGVWLTRHVPVQFLSEMSGNDSALHAQ